MKIIIILIGLILLLISLNNARKVFWGKQQLLDDLEKGKQKLNQEQQENVSNPKIVFIYVTIYILLEIIFYSANVNILFPSTIRIIPMIFVLLSIYEYIRIGYNLIKKGIELKFRQNNIFEISIIITRSAYIIAFIVFYITK